MDPTATLRMIADDLDDNPSDPRERNRLCADLRDWLDEHQAFEPDWDAYPEASDYFGLYVEAH